MELKYLHRRGLAYLSSYSNRTFMELKCENLISVSRVFPLLQSHLYGIEILFLGQRYEFRIATPIAPLWNWNPFAVAFIPLIHSNSNRTFMELKFTDIAKTIWNTFNSNRTFMELKWEFNAGFVNQQTALQSHLYGIEIVVAKACIKLRNNSNRTFMELKLFKPSPLYACM